MATKVSVEPKWILIDAKGQVLGKLAVKIATILMGKHKPTFTRHTDTGDFVVVINADKFVVTGNKMEDKIYYHNTKYPGGLRTIALKEQLVKKPTEPLRNAVRKMLPKTKLGKQMFTKLKTYAGTEHPHEAQKPEPISL